MAPDSRIPNPEIGKALGRVAVTGASGFIGTHLVQALRCSSVEALPLVRRATAGERAPVAGTAPIVVDLTHIDALAQALAGVDVVIHCAGYAHAHEDLSPDAEEKHRQINCELALRSARAAARAGVRRFVFCSSVKAMGDPGAQCVDESFAAPPDTAYGRAKRAAEDGLAQIGKDTGLEVVVLRLAMVYGPGSRGNLERMLRLAARGRFPPLPETGNKRSMVHVADVVEAMLLAAVHPGARGRTYIVAHPRPLSGRALYEQIRAACGQPPQCWSVPAALLRAAGLCGDVAGHLLGRRIALDSQAVSRLLDSACYVPAALQAELGWMPRVDIATGLKSLLAGPGSHGDRIETAV